MKQSMTTPGPTGISAVADLFKPGKPSQSLENVLGSFPPGKDRKPTSLALVVRNSFARASKRKAILGRLPHPPQPQTFTLDEVEGALTNLFHTLDVERVGTITLTLPFGLDHYVVNAATFKALAGREGDTLLRQTGDRWEIVEDDEPIDLGDRTQLFRLGRVQIYS
jgi:hypothetical protein